MRVSNPFRAVCIAIILVVGTSAGSWAANYSQDQGFSSFAKGLLYFLERKDTDELARLLHYEAPGSGLAGEPIYQILLNLRIKNPGAVETLSKAIQQVVKRQNISTREFLGRWHNEISLAIEFTGKQIALENILCSDEPQFSKSGNFIADAVEASQLLYVDDEKRVFAPAIHRHARETIALSLTRCASVVNPSAPVQASAYMQFVENLLYAQNISPGVERLLAHRDR